MVYALHIAVKSKGFGKHSDCHAVSVFTFYPWKCFLFFFCRNMTSFTKFPSLVTKSPRCPIMKMRQNVSQPPLESSPCHDGTRLWLGLQGSDLGVWFTGVDVPTAGTPTRVGTQIPLRSEEPPRGLRHAAKGGVLIEEHYNDVCHRRWFRSSGWQEGREWLSEPMEQKGKWLREEVATVAVVGREEGGGVWVWLVQWTTPRASECREGVLLEGKTPSLLPTRCANISWSWGTVGPLADACLWLAAT